MQEENILKNIKRLHYYLQINEFYDIGLVTFCLLINIYLINCVNFFIFYIKTPTLISVDKFDKFLNNKTF